jgi:hypothetical protein
MKETSADLLLGYENFITELDIPEKALAGAVA